MLIPVGTVISERYEIIEKLGTGGMAVVYRARDKKLDRFVTVKVLRDELLSNSDFKLRFHVEARAAASLSHPNIVNVYDVGQDGEVHYIVMEYIHGDTLKKAIQQKAPFDSLATLSVAIQIASALSHAHKHRVVHRDIKPQNILVAVDGTIKVTDFGIARAVTANTLTTSANAAGSVYYFSPEQARGGYVDEKSDIYSLGITMFEMVAGKVPFTGKSSVEIALKHLKEELPDMRQWNPNVSKSLENIIRKATRKKSDERYATIDAMLADLKKSLTDPSGDFVASAAPVKKQTPAAEDTDAAQEKAVKPLPSAVSKKRELPESGVGFDKYQDRLDTEEEDDEYEDKKQEKKVVFAAVATAIVIIAVISVVGLKGLAMLKGDAPDKKKEPEVSQEEKPVKAVAPNLVGLTFAQAQAKAERLNITISKNGEEFSKKYEEGSIISQSIEEGNDVKEGDVIQVVVSKGLESFEMPNLVGQEEAAARTALVEAEGINDVKIQHEASTAEQIGKVIRQQPAQGTKVNKDSKVILTVGTGEEEKKIKVPNVKGKTQEAATDEIVSAGLSLGKVTKASSNTVEKGQVIQQTVTAGTMVEAESSVGLVVSTGKEETVKPAETTNPNPAGGTQDKNDNAGSGGTAKDPSTGSSPMGTDDDNQTTGQDQPQVSQPDTKKPETEQPETKQPETQPQQPSGTEPEPPSSPTKVETPGATDTANESPAPPIGGDV